MDSVYSHTKHPKPASTELLTNFQYLSHYLGPILVGISINVIAIAVSSPSMGSLL